jgi:uncharacterized protein
MDKIDRVKQCLMKYKPERIIIFGSCARDDSDEYSDIDVVIIKQTDKRFIERLIEASKFLDNDLGKVDVFVYTQEEFEGMKKRRNPFIETVLEEGRVIYQS